MPDPTHIRLDESRFETSDPLYRACGALAQAIRGQDGGVYPTTPIEVARLRRMADQPAAAQLGGWPSSELHACIDAHLSPVPALLAHHREMLERIDTIDVVHHLEARFRQYGGLMVAADPLGPDQGLIVVDRSDVYTHIAAIFRVEAADGSTAYEVRREDIEDCTEPGEEDSSITFGTLALAMQDLLYDLRDASSFGSVTVAKVALAELLAALRTALWEHLAETGRRWVQS